MEEGGKFQRNARKFSKFKFQGSKGPIKYPTHHNEWKRPTSRHMSVKFQDPNDKEKVLKNTQRIMN